MLQAMLEAMLQAKEGGEGGDFSPGVTSTPRNPDVQDVRSSVVDVGGFGGAAEPRSARAARKPRHRPIRAQRIEFWHDIFRHLNSGFARHFGGRQYPWDIASRKILANAARKYGAGAVMAMWDISLITPGYWFKKTGGAIYGMVRDSEYLLESPDFKRMAREYQQQLLKQHELFDAILNP